MDSSAGTATFDYIIVGAGSSGCVVANRLSADPSCRVLLLEAGGTDRPAWIHVPLGYGKTINDPKVNWRYETEPEPELLGRRIFWPRGKVLGGSSSINGHTYMRGQAQDYDHWRQLGNPGWSYADVLPLFKRSEHQSRGADAFHGVGGPLHVGELPRNALSDAFVEAAMAIGIPRNDDFNGARQDGVGYFQPLIRNGRRASTSVAFLRPVRRRPNLHVETDAYAERVVLEGKRAVGVVYRRHGETVTTRCTREIVLCGGAINSPHLLLLSGIGPEAHLREHGIEVRHHLPGVGQNLQDHFASRLVHKARFPLTVNDLMRSPVRKLRAGMQYALFRSGPLSRPVGSVCLFDRTRPELDSPDIQFHFLGFSTDTNASGLHDFSGFTTSVCQLRPESRGSIGLNGADPTRPPAIRANYMSTELDRATIVAGLRLAREICAQPAMQHHILSEYRPGPDVATDDELLAYSREVGASIYHPVGTCKMGHDAQAVVDPALRVHGIDGLRVADASIMPTIVSGNTNAAAIMIGEKLSDLVADAASLRLVA